ncbi:MAG: ATP-binding protein [Actinomycetota bacterium]|nr:ATP-binding protein [Actinomycetota bacterium]
MNAALAFLAAVLFFSYVRHIEPLNAGFHFPWWLLASVFCVTEILVVHLEFKREAHSFSLGEIPLVLALFFSSPSELMLAQIVGVGCALVLYRRQSPTKLAFNLANFALEAALAIMLFHFWADLGMANGPVGWTAAFFATLLVTSLGAVMIALAISLAEGQVKLETLTKSLAPSFAVTAANTSLALLAVTLLARSPQALWLLLIVLGVLFLSYRSYTSMRTQHDSLGALYESTRVAHQSLEMDAVLLSLLSSGCEMFRAEMAEIVLFPQTVDEPAYITTLGPGEQLDVMRAVELDPTEGVWARVAAEGRAVLVPRPISNVRLRTYFAARGVRDAIAAPLHGESGVVGSMMVANRLSDVSTFCPEDVTLIETLANHASVSLENARLVDRLKESLIHLTEMNRLKDDFVATVSHELRTPLTSISGYIKILARKSDKLSSEQKSLFVNTIEEQSDRLRCLIEDLLIVSRIESGNHSISESSVSLRDLATAVSEEIGARSSRHRFEIALSSDFPLLLTDAEKLRQILANLVENASKYTPPDTTIYISGRREGDGVAISVEDEGAGVPAHLHEKVFERFYQVDQSSTRRNGGTGLGLYICRKLAEVLGGSLALERSDGAGSIFTLRLPASSVLEVESPGEDECEPPRLLALPRAESA